MNPAVELDDLVTLSDIASRLSVSRQRAHQLAAVDGFPAPLGQVGAAVVWRWPDVEAWNAGRTRKRGPSRAEGASTKST